MFCCYFQGAAPAWSAATGTGAVDENVASGTAITVTQTLTNTPTSVAIQSSTPAGGSSLFAVALNGAATGVTLTTAGTIDAETSTTYALTIRYEQDDRSNCNTDDWIYGRSKLALARPRTAVGSAYDSRARGSGFDTRFGHPYEVGEGSIVIPLSVRLSARPSVRLSVRHDFMSAHTSEAL